jgi:hypothetical protein
VEHKNASGQEAGTRPPTIEDLKNICSRFNAADVKYILIGGLAINYYGLPRATQDIDFLVDPSCDNISRIREALLFLPDKASKDLDINDVNQYMIVRIADEIIIDLIGKIGDLDFASAGTEAAYIDDVQIKIADLDTLIKTKQGFREKDKSDLQFLLMLKK